MRVLVYGMVGINRGGIETYLLKMNKYMSEDTIFDYVVEGNVCIHEKEILEKGGHIYYIPKRHEHPFKNVLANKKLLKKLNKDIDAIYFNLSSLSWIRPIKIAKKLGYRVYVHSHNSQFEKVNGNLLYRIVNKINKHKIHKMNICRLTCSKPAKNFMFYENDDVKMIHNAINCESFIYNGNKREIMKNELSLNDEKIVGFVGRINTPKNPLYLIEIMKELRKKQCNVKILVLGDGPMKEELQNKIKEENLEEYFILCGNVSNVSDYMQIMDVFILPSLYEGLPYVAVEAQASGLPCIIADNVTREVKITDNIQFLKVSENSKNWSNAILNILENNSIDRKSSNEIVEKSNFNIFIEANRLEEILRGKDD